MADSRPVMRILPIQSPHSCHHILKVHERNWAKRGLVAQTTRKRTAKTVPCNYQQKYPSVIIRPLGTSTRCLALQRSQHPRTLIGVKASQDDAEPSPGARLIKSEGKHRHSQPPDVLEVAGSIAAVDRVTKAFFAKSGLRTEETTLAAMRACANTDAEPDHDCGEVPQEVKLHSTASYLLNLDSIGLDGAAEAKTDRRSTPSLKTAVDKMSESIFAIVSHPAVHITPRLLAEYVDIQVRLGRPETLPQMLGLYATKPRPRLVSGSLELVVRNPKKAENAVEANVAEAALDAAIAARNLDAAVGIVEKTYGSAAFLRAKLVKKALLPISIFTATPVAAYMVAAKLSQLQDTMDQNTATMIAFSGITAYVGFTAALGLIALGTANDQMKRVTWIPGAALRQRWMREEERAALDKVARSFGFSDPDRYGEEEGEEFALFREYLLRKGMILDAVELMPGMA